MCTGEYFPPKGFTFTGAGRSIVLLLLHSRPHTKKEKEKPPSIFHTIRLVIHHESRVHRSLNYPLLRSVCTCINKELIRRSNPIFSLLFFFFFFQRRLLIWFRLDVVVVVFVVIRLKVARHIQVYNKPWLSGPMVIVCWHARLTVERRAYNKR